jgi:hypothetical protein
MNDYEINLQIISKTITLLYVSELSHGDSYHKLYIDGTEFSAYVWGCNFLFPYEQKYLVCSYMKKLYERKTVIINLKNLKYYILPKYYHRFSCQNNSIKFEETDSCEIEKLTLNQIEEKLGAFK